MRAQINEIGNTHCKGSKDHQKHKSCFILKISKINKLIGRIKKKTRVGTNQHCQEHQVHRVSLTAIKVVIRGCKLKFCAHQLENVVERSKHLENNTTYKSRHKQKENSGKSLWCLLFIFTSFPILPKNSKRGNTPQPILCNSINKPDKDMIKKKNHSQSHL